jgi:hypothetical protein
MPRWTDTSVRDIGPVVLDRRLGLRVIVRVPVLDLPAELLVPLFWAKRGEFEREPAERIDRLAPLARGELRINWDNLRCHYLGGLIRSTAGVALVSSVAPR